MLRQYVLKTGQQWFVLVLLCVMAATASAEDKSSAAGAQSAFVYKPPLRGMPGARVGGGTRGTGLEAAKIMVLTPDHVGLTTQAQPTLYWYTDSPVAAQFEFALIDNNEIDPLLEIEINEEPAAGIRQLDIGEYGITLKPGVAYQWSVVLVADENNRSTDIFSTGTIERIEPDKALSSRVKQSTGTDLVAVYASEGIWYDALDTISTLIEQSPGDQGLLSVRDSLLDQAGLSIVATK